MNDHPAINLPFPLTDRYYRFSHFLKQKYGERVYRVSLDAGFTCPTRDGALGTGGCIYCNNNSFSANQRRNLPTVEAQLQQGVARLKARGVQKFIAYFQTYTNTYDTTENLMRLFQSAANTPGVVALAIGTRPDTICGDLMDRLADMNRWVDISVEIGIESVYEKTLQWAERGHDFATTRQTIAALKQRGISVAGHYILGFPTETKSEMLAAAGILNELKIDALKLHHLHIVKQTKLATLFGKNPFHLFSADEWVTFIADFLELLSPAIVIQRLIGDAIGDTLIGPVWQTDKTDVLKRIRAELTARNTWQGRRENLDE